MWPVASTKRLLDTGADDARNDHVSERHTNSDDIVPMALAQGGGRKKMATGARTGGELTGTGALKRGIPPGARGGIQILGMVPRSWCAKKKTQLQRCGCVQ